MKFLQATLLGLMATAATMMTATSAFSLGPAGRSAVLSRSRVSLMMSEETSAAVEETAPATAAEEAAPAAPVEPEKHTVYVGNLPFSSTREQISDLFSEQGISVINVAMPTNQDRLDDAGMPTSKGFCFVDVASEDMIATAVDAFHQMDLNGRPMRVNKLLPKEEVQKQNTRGKNFTPDGQKKLYVGNLPFEAEYDQIKEHFTQYGDVGDLYIPMRDNQSRGFCFVTMSAESADKAMAELDGADFMGRPLVVNEPLKKGETLAPRAPRPKQFKLYVGNLSFYTTRETLEGVFEEFGEVFDCYLPTDPQTDQPRGFGFITMAQEDGEIAINELDGLELDGRFIRVNEAQGKRRPPPTQEYSNDGGDVNEW
uniref:RRM domain-containing protein n=1 Tax=Pseudo-nitzschia australis TaxID=44445 RepID=A0A7S4EFP4_9STRA|mmetsp:Transcript_18890/g.39728  ORF Transcript_18890/g.39728 Transcript_18890/m.39728 type:complete len:369 (-) Transcript_18890:232-1338(-)|eukprot:CAMPEP_0168194756 /NCGR_PEP_ID=MMETSP0139_2-20121125/19424_1 /TAXON_ID=44445 /ORGANISM="Pseudo-nitzschia australis, Strain 10249 10 AB" /LENGTH=368 /DNA_ID=CAMNT_0008118429 /DNA_START=130 /DNA_END=1236 /DNA_ORIENTATION=+